jgi:hypothetical protein
MIFARVFFRDAVFGGDRPIAPLLSLAAGVVSVVARATRPPRLTLEAGAVSSEFRN